MGVLEGSVGKLCVEETEAWLYPDPLGAPAEQGFVLCISFGNRGGKEKWLFGVIFARMVLEQPSLAEHHPVCTVIAARLAGSNPPRAVAQHELLSR